MSSAYCNDELANTRSYSRSRHESSVQNVISGSSSRPASQTSGTSLQWIVDVDLVREERAAQQGEVSDAAAPVEDRDTIALAARQGTTRMRRRGSGSARSGSARPRGRRRGRERERPRAARALPGTPAAWRGTRRRRSRRPSRGCRRRCGPSPPGRTPIRGRLGATPCRTRRAAETTMGGVTALSSSPAPVPRLAARYEPPPAASSRLIATHPAKFRQRQKHSTRRTRRGATGPRSTRPRRARARPRGSTASARSPPRRSRWRA